MPELPEVETVRRGLMPVMEDTIIESAEIRRKNLRFDFPPDQLADRLAGRKIVALGRRSKYLLADLDDDMVLVMHLGMSGSFRVVTADENHLIADDAFHAARGARNRPMTMLSCISLPEMRCCTTTHAGLVFLI